MHTRAIKGILTFRVFREGNNGRVPGSFAALRRVKVWKHFSFSLRTLFAGKDDTFKNTTRYRSARVRIYFVPDIIVCVFVFPADCSSSYETRAPHVYYIYIYMYTRPRGGGEEGLYSIFGRWFLFSPHYHLYTSPILYYGRTHWVFIYKSRALSRFFFFLGGALFWFSSENRLATDAALSCKPRARRVITSERYDDNRVYSGNDNIIRDSLNEHNVQP